MDQSGGLNRVLSIYQALPGPEAHELCVYFGMLAGGRAGAFLAGLGFMLPGFGLMLALSWFYVAYGISSPLFQSIFMGMQPAVAALIVRAVHRIWQPTRCTTMPGFGRLHFLAVWLNC